MFRAITQPEAQVDDQAGCQKHSGAFGRHRHQVGAKGVRAHQVAVERHGERTAMDQYIPSTRRAP